MSTTEQKALELAESYAQANAAYRLESLYGTSKSYTAEKEGEVFEARAELFAELRRLSAEKEALLADAQTYQHAREALALENSELATQLATKDAELATLRAQVEALTIENQALWNDRSTLQNQRDAFLQAGLRARHALVKERDALSECHTRPDGEIDADGARAVAEFNAVIAHIDSAVEGAKMVHPTPSPLTRPAVPDKDLLADLIREHMTSVYHCGRVWEAWSVGTMSEDDFSPYAKSDSPDELADAILAMLAAAPQPEVQPQQQDASCDRHYIAGMKAGWNFAQTSDEDGFQKSVEGRLREIQESNSEAQPSEAAQPELPDPQCSKWPRCGCPSKLECVNDLPQKGGA